MSVRGLGVGVGSAIACDWIGQQITQRANYVKIGKNRDNKEKGDGCLAGVRKQGKAGWVLRRFFIMGQWACVLRAWCLVSVSVRSMTPHIAHTQRVQGIGHEYGEDVVWAGSAEEIGVS